MKIFLSRSNGRNHDIAIERLHFVVNIISLSDVRNRLLPYLPVICSVCRQSVRASLSDIRAQYICPFFDAVQLNPGDAVATSLVARMTE